MVSPASTSVRTTEAIGLLDGFCERTGLAGRGPGRRYLWTDAFAVCTLLGIERGTGDARHRERALALVDRVHHVLGRHRSDDVRTGWLSGLDERDGEAHPTSGGLRIGKPLPERSVSEPPDERREWDRDGQYFHYLTKWMHALDQATRATGQSLFSVWARELAVTAHRTFAYTPRLGSGRRMYWKLSVDLTRPLVDSMGQHDPLDGYVTCLQLDATLPDGTPALRDARADFVAMLDPRALATADPLGIGGLLADAFRLAQMPASDARSIQLLPEILAAAGAGLEHYARRGEWRAPADARLAFRELGLAIGLAAVEQGAWAHHGDAVILQLDALRRFLPLRDAIEDCWLDANHRRGPGWRDHEDINDVMLAASLVPEGFLVLHPPQPFSGAI